MCTPGLSARVRVSVAYARSRVATQDPQPASPAEVDGGDLFALVAEFPRDGLPRMLVGLALRGRELATARSAGGRRVEPGQLAVARLGVRVPQPVQLRQAGALGLPLVQPTLLQGGLPVVTEQERTLSALVSAARRATLRDGLARRQLGPGRSELRLAGCELCLACAKLLAG